MKLLLILMIILSLAVGIPFNGVSNSLYAAEFTNTIGLIKAGTLTTVQLINWIMLLIAHLGVLSLLFISQKAYFKKLLIGAPIAFILLYVLYASIFIIVLLIPFIFFWILALVNQKKPQQR